MNSQILWLAYQRALVDKGISSKHLFTEWSTHLKVRVRKEPQAGSRGICRWEDTIALPSSGSHSSHLSELNPESGTVLLSSRCL